MIRLRAPRGEEAASLTALCLRSKAAWGYDEAFIQLCRDELKVTPAACKSGVLQVAEIDDAIAGVAGISVNREIATLEKLFVEPARFRCGCGRALFDWAKAASVRAGAALLVIDSDPGAASFYRRMGAVDAGSVPSGSIPGRVLPRLTLRL